MATFNIENGLGSQGTIKYSSILAILQRIDADVIALQELVSGSVDLATLAYVLGYDYVLYNQSSSMRNGLISRYPIAEYHWISNPGMIRPILLAQIDMPTAVVDPWVTSLHLKCCNDDPFGSEQRTRATELFWLKNAITNFVPTNAPIAIMGDFNLISDIDRIFTNINIAGVPDPLAAPASADGYFVELGIFKMDARHAGMDGESWTWRGSFQFPPSALDHIMVNGIIRARSNAVEIFDVEKDALGIVGLPKKDMPLPSGTDYGSDHLPVFADFDVEAYPGDIQDLVTGISPEGDVQIVWQPTVDASGYNVYIDDQPYTSTTNTVVSLILTETAEYRVTVIPTNHLGNGNGKTVILRYGDDPYGFIAQADPVAYTSNHVFTGQSGWAFSSTIEWQNWLTGASGSFLASANWTNVIPLATGTNSFHFRAGYEVGGYVDKAFDSATNAPYVTTFVNGWLIGQNGGYGFGPWELGATANSGVFIANNPANMNLGENYGFGLWANSGGTSIATRVFAEPLKPGDVLSVNLDINWVSYPGWAGMMLIDNQGVFQQYIYAQNDIFYINGSTMPTALTNSGMAAEFRMHDNGAYSFAVRSLATGALLIPEFQDRLPSGRQITKIQFINSSAGPGSDYDFFVGSLSIKTPEVDYVSYGPVNVVRIDNNDRDGDGLPDSVETGTGSFVAGYDTGSNPNNPDTSGDGIWDGEAVAAGLNPNVNYSEVIGVIVSGAATTPGRFGLYTESGIMDLSMGDVVLRPDGTNALLEFQIETSEDVENWQSNSVMRTTLPLQEDKRFIRIRAPQTQY